MDVQVSVVLQRVADEESAANARIASLRDEIAKQQQTLEEIRLFRTMLAVYASEGAQSPVRQAAEEMAAAPSGPVLSVVEPATVLATPATREERMALRDQLFGWGAGRRFQAS